MKAYLLGNNEIEFTNNEKPLLPLICERDFTDDEIQFYKPTVSGNDIEVDLVKKTNFEALKLEMLYSQRLKEIDEKTARLIIESGYLFKGQLMSSSDIHRAELESLHNNKDSVEIQAVYPFNFANKDNTGFVEILDAADIHSMYIALNLTSRFSKKMAGNAEKLKINNIMNGITKNPDGSNMSVQDKINALQNYVDLRV